MNKILSYFAISYYQSHLFPNSCTVLLCDMHITKFLRNSLMTDILLLIYPIRSSILIHYFLTSINT